MAKHRRVPLAWRNLSENKWRLLASALGTAFAVVLMVLQSGFRDALLDNMAAVIAHMDGDLFLTSRLRYVVSHPAPFAFRRIVQALDVAGVTKASPVYIDAEQARWRNVSSTISRRIRVVAYPPEDDVFDIPAVRAQRDAWNQPETALADERSKAGLYGPLSPGTTSELQGKRIRIVGTFSLGTDFRTNGTLLLSERNFLTHVPERLGASWAETAIDVGVLRTSHGADRDQLKAKVAAKLPADVIVLTKPELIAKEQAFWENVAPLGVVFDIGVAMGFIVGLAICYQVLFSEITDRIGEFATLKAMGFTNAGLLRIIVEESIYLALLGFAAGLVVSVGLFRWIESATGLEMALRPLGGASVLGLTVLMCVLAGVLAARRLLSLDPAELYS